MEPTVFVVGTYYDKLTSLTSANGTYDNANAWLLKCFATYSMLVVDTKPFDYNK